MQRALRSEFGAYSFYSLLPRWARQKELKALLIELRDDQREIISLLRQTIEDLGGRPAKSRWTRSVAAWVLFFATPILGMRFSLRLCFEAERTVSRWHAEYAIFLAERGRTDLALRLEELGASKYRHAVRLETFVNNL